MPKEFESCTAYIKHTNKGEKEMAYYAYKTVRDLLPEHIIKQMGENYEGDGNYDGDQWYAAEAYILELKEQRDKLLEALQECLTAIEWCVEQGGGPACEHEGGVVCFCKENNAINSARAAIAKAIRVTTNTQPAR